MKNIAKLALIMANGIQQEVPKIETPPSETSISKTELLFPFSIVKGTRGYIEKVTHQINGSYAQGWYDSCAVMIRRLIETLIIESFECYKIESKIKNPNGDYLFLGELISKTLNEPSWTLGRNTKKALPHLKDIGDQSAHNRRYIAHREDIDKVSEDIRLVVQEFIYLSKLK